MTRSARIGLVAGLLAAAATLTIMVLGWRLVGVAAAVGTVVGTATALTVESLESRRADLRARRTSPSRPAP